MSFFSVFIVLSRGRYEKKTYKYALNIVDVASGTKDHINWPLRIVKR